MSKKDQDHDGNKEFGKNNLNFDKAGSNYKYETLNKNIFYDDSDSLSDSESVINNEAVIDNSTASCSTSTRHNKSRSTSTHAHAHTSLQSKQEPCHLSEDKFNDKKQDQFDDGSFENISIQEPSLLQGDSKKKSEFVHQNLSSEQKSLSESDIYSDEEAIYKRFFPIRDHQPKNTRRIIEEMNNNSDSKIRIEICNDHDILIYGPLKNHVDDAYRKLFAKLDGKEKYPIEDDERKNKGAMYSKKISCKDDKIPLIKKFIHTVNKEYEGISSISNGNVIFAHKHKHVVEEVYMKYLEYMYLEEEKQLKTHHDLGKGSMQSEHDSGTRSTMDESNLGTTLNSAINRSQNTANNSMQVGRCKEVAHQRLITFEPWKKVFLENYIPEMLQKDHPTVECDFFQQTEVKLSSFSETDVSKAFKHVDKTILDVRKKDVPFTATPSKLDQERRFIWRDYRCIATPLTRVSSPQASEEKHFFPVMHHFCQGKLNLYIMQGDLDHVCLKSKICIVPDEGPGDAQFGRNSTHDKDGKCQFIRLGTDLEKEKFKNQIDSALKHATTQSDEVGIMIADNIHCPLHIIADLFVSLFMKIRKQASIYLFSNRKESICRAFKFFCSSHHMEEKIAKKKVLGMPYAISEKTIDLKSLYKNEDTAVYVDREDKIEPYARTLACFPVIVHEVKDYMKCHIQAHCYEHVRRYLEDRVLKEINADPDILSLGKTFGPFSCHGEKMEFLLYYTPEWSFDAALAIRRALADCKKVIGFVYDAWIFVPPGISLDDTYKYPEKFVAQQVFLWLDTLFKTKKLRDHRLEQIHLRIKHSPYDRAFLDELKKREPKGFFNSLVSKFTGDKNKAVEFDRPELRIVGICIENAFQKLKINGMCGDEGVFSHKPSYNETKNYGSGMSSAHYVGAAREGVERRSVHTISKPSYSGATKASDYVKHSSDYGSGMSSATREGGDRRSGYNKDQEIKGASFQDQGHRLGHATDQPKRSTQSSRTSPVRNSTSKVKQGANRGRPVHKY